MTRLEVHADARAELLHAVSFYESQVPGLGLRFIAEIERCHGIIVDTPLVGRRYGRSLRKLRVGDKFPYSILYAVLADTTFIVAYAHGARRPGYWQARLVR